MAATSRIIAFEEEIEFESFVRLPIRVLRTMLFELERRKLNLTRKETFKFFLKINFFRFCMVSIFGAITSILIYAKMYTSSFAEASIVVNNALTFATMLVKSFTTFWNREKILLVFGKLNELFKDRPNHYSTYNVKPYLKSCQRFMKVYAAALFLIVFVSILVSFQYFIDGTMKFRIDFWFPFDPFKPSVFPLVSLWTFFVYYTCIAGLFGAEGILFGMIAVLKMEFDFLKMDYMKLKDVTKNNKEQQFAKLVDRHNKLFDLSDMIQNIYQKAFLFIFLTGSIVMCLASFQLLTEKNISKTLSFDIPYVVIFSGQIFLYCFFGQKLIDSSGAVAEGIYNSGWENVDDNAYKKNLLLVLLRSQRPKELSTMNFTIICYESYTSVRFSK